MNKKILVIIPIVAAIAYFAIFSEDTDSMKFLDIADYEIISNESSPLFLSVTVLQDIPERLEIGNEGYGFGWMLKEDQKLYGYISNIHTGSEWHTEYISIDDAEKFCFDSADLIISKVMIDKNKINVIIEQNDLQDFDRIITYNITKDDNCHYGFAGKIIDEFEIK